MFKYGEDAVKITTGNKDGRVLREHYVHAIKNNRIQDNLYEQSKAIQEQRSAEIREHFEVPVSRAKVLNLIPKQQVRNLPKNTLNQRYSKLRDKIKRKYGVAPATYYRRKKEGYYD
jgi:ribosomal protein S26